MDSPAFAKALMLGLAALYANAHGRAVVQALHNRAASPRAR